MTENTDPVQATVSSLAMAILKESFEKGKEIRIPSLGITISPDKEEEGEFLIWWLNQPDTERLMEALDAGDIVLPEPIYSEVRSRSGRAGRGRLWVPSDIPIKEIPWPQEKFTTRWAQDCGGIVFRASDMPSVRGLAGFVTDLEMELVR